MVMHVEKGAPVRKGSFLKKFKGRCRKCGKQGHKASDCKSDKKCVCFNCGEDGHFARKCPKKASPKPTKEGSGMFVGMAECGMSASSNNTEFVEFLLDSDELLTLSRGARVTTKKYLRCDNAGENIKG